MKADRLPYTFFLLGARLLTAAGPSFSQKSPLYASSIPFFIPHRKSPTLRAHHHGMVRGTWALACLAFVPLSSGSRIPSLIWRLLPTPGDTGLVGLSITASALSRPTGGTGPRPEPESYVERQEDFKTVYSFRRNDSPFVPAPPRVLKATLFLSLSVMCLTCFFLELHHRPSVHASLFTVWGLVSFSCWRPEPLTPC